MHCELPGHVKYSLIRSASRSSAVLASAVERVLGELCNVVVDGMDPVMYVTHHHLSHLTPFFYVHCVTASLPLLIISRITHSLISKSTVEISPASIQITRSLSSGVMVSNIVFSALLIIM